MKRLMHLVILLLLVGLGDLCAGEITIDAEKKFQVIHGFGTCMKTWGSPDKDPVTKWQRDSACHKLYVEELGFTMVRIPINKWVLDGPNPYKIPVVVTQEMKDDPTRITHDKFSWERDQGRSGDVPIRQINWAKALLALNPEIKVFGSVWSPPHWMKEKGKKGAGTKFNWSKFGSSSCGGRLSEKYYTHYAYYLSAWSKGLKAKFGIVLYAVSVQNELLFYEPYDSCVYDYGDFAPVVKEIGRVFEKEGIQTRIMGPEDMTKFPDRTKRYLAPFAKDAEARDYLDIVCSHGYADGIETNLDAGDAAKLWSIMQQVVPGKEYWMTETGGGSGDWQDVETTYKKGKNKGQKQVIPGALSGLGAMLHNAIVYGQASVWTTWQFLGTDKESKHGLIYVTMDKMTPTKKFYVQKHYSRYIPAGARRIAAGPDGEEKIAVSAYVLDKKEIMTVVLQNHGVEARTVPLVFNVSPAGASMELYITDEKKNCERAGKVEIKGGKCSVSLPPRCIATLTNINGQK